MTGQQYDEDSHCACAARLADWLSAEGDVIKGAVTAVEVVEEAEVLDGLEVFDGVEVFEGVEVVEEAAEEGNVLQYDRSVATMESLAIPSWRDWKTVEFGGSCRPVVKEAVQAMEGLEILKEAEDEGSALQDDRSATTTESLAMPARRI